MADKMLTIRMDEQEHRALKLHAVLQGRSINGLVLDLVRVELAKSAPSGGGRSREEFVAELLDRFGIDPESPEHRAAAARAQADIQYSDGDRASGGKDGSGERGAA